MAEINKFKEILDLCNGAHNKTNVRGWDTLYEFDNLSPNKEFNARVYKQNNKIVIAIAGTNMTSLNDLKNDNNILRYTKIPSQYGDAERLYTKVKQKYPDSSIEFTGYSLGGSIANLMSHRTGLPSNALAPIGSLHIAKAYPEYFKYNGDNITTYGRSGDILFNSNIDKQSGNIIILPDLSAIEQGNHPKNFENHYLHNFQPYQFYQAKPYQTTSYIQKK